MKNLKGGIGQSDQQLCSCTLVANSIHVLRLTNNVRITCGAVLCFRQVNIRIRVDREALASNTDAVGSEAAMSTRPKLRNSLWAGSSTSSTRDSTNAGKMGS